VAILLHGPMLATTLAGENFNNSSRSCCAFSRVSRLNVHEVMWSLSECWIGSAVDFAARASRSLKSETGLA
jgi:hypothetical protein